MAGWSPPGGRDIAYRGFRGRAELGAGTLNGTRLSADGVEFAHPTGRFDYTDPHTGRTGSYESASWTSPQVRPGFPATEIIPSWTADTPGASWLQLDLRGVTDTGRTTRWYTLARWAAEDTAVRRTTLGGQRDADGSVDADTFTAGPGRALVSWQLRVTLLRPVGSALTPRLRSIGAVASRLPAPATTPDGASATTGASAAAPDRRPSDGPAPAAAGHPRIEAAAEGQSDSAPGNGAGPASGVVLAVPSFSQMTHSGHYPQWDGGGEAWCSPTSTAMVLAFWGTGPTPGEYAWVDPTDPRPWVDHAARHCFDYAYRGAGNWPFNTAYAGRYGLDAFVTRLRSLAEAELFIAAGVPLIVSASYRRGQVPGLDYDTLGHLMVLVGFTAAGEPVLNDPNAPTDAAVRKRVDRDRFEAAWLAASGGLVYVIRPPAVALPPPPRQANW